MSQTPFTLGTVTVPGAQQPRIRDVVPGSVGWWLGQAGNMIRIPGPSVGFDEAVSQSESTIVNLDGGTFTRRRASVKRQWPFQWQRLAGRDWQIVYAFYRRLFGEGPWCLVIPDDVNRLSEAQSICAPGDDSPEWSASAGTLAAGTGSPLLPSGVLVWTSPGASGVLTAGNGAATVNPATAVPYLPGESITFSVYLMASAARTFTVRLSGFDAAGAYLASVTATVAVTATGYTQGVVTVGPSNGTLAGAVYVTGQVVAPTVSVPASVSIAAAQLEFRGSASAWGLGMGVPRVTCTSMTPRTVASLYANNVTMNLAEA
jgi:hypothetical protein